METVSTKARARQDVKCTKKVYNHGKCAKTVLEYDRLKVTYFSDRSREVVYKNVFCPELNMLVSEKLVHHKA